MFFLSIENPCKQSDLKNLRLWHLHFEPVGKCAVGKNVKIEAWYSGEKTTKGFVNNKDYRTRIDCNS